MNVLSSLFLAAISFTFPNKDAVSKEKNWDDFNSSLLIETKRDGKTYTCTGVAIAPNMVLTAAHCVDEINSARILLDVSYNALSKNSIETESFFKHPLYNVNNSNFKHDIAIIVLKEDLPKNINIVKVADSKKIAEDKEVDRIGFGGRNNINSRTWTNPKIKGKTLDQLNIVLNDTGSVVGDSGGPVYIKEAGSLKLLGIHSTLEGNDTTYSVNVSEYKSWINEHKLKTSLAQAM